MKWSAPTLTNYSTTLSSISIIALNSIKNSTQSLPPTLSAGTSDTSSSISLSSSTYSLLRKLGSNVVASLATSESGINLPKSMRRRNQNLVSGAASDESCIYSLSSTEGTGATGTASSISIITSDVSITRLESFIRDIKLTSPTEYDTQNTEQIQCYLDRAT